MVKSGESAGETAACERDPETHVASRRISSSVGFVVIVVNSQKAVFVMAIQVLRFNRTSKPRRA